MKTNAHLYQTTFIIGLQIVCLQTRAQIIRQAPQPTIHKTTTQVKVRRQKYFTLGFNLGGAGWSPSTTSQVSGNGVLTRTPSTGFSMLEYNNGVTMPSITTNTSLGINGGFLWHDKHKDAYTSIQLELQSNKASYTANNPFVYEWHGQQIAQWVEGDKYIKYSIALQRAWYLGKSHFLGGSKYWYIRESFGQTALHRDLSTNPYILVKPGYAEDWTQNGTGMKSLITSAIQNSYMLGTEIGLKQFTLNNKHSLDLGLVYYAPFANSFTEKYQFFKQGSEVGTSSVTYNGGTLMFNLRYSINYQVKNKPVDTTKVIEKEELVNTHKINGRHTDVQKTIQVPTDLVTAYVWDEGLVDGDQISLYLNGQLVLVNYSLVKEKKQIPLHLVAGVNYLSMYAVNLGSVPPNTAAIEIDDSNSRRRQTFTLVSDMQKNGTIKIIYNP